MINFHRTKLLRDLINDVNSTFETTINTQHFVPENIRSFFAKYIKKTLAKDIRSLEREDKYFQKRYRHFYKKLRQKVIDREVIDLLNLKYADEDTPADETEESPSEAQTPAEGEKKGADLPLLAENDAEHNAKVFFQEIGWEEKE